MVSVQNPVVEKLTFGWHNHFATSATKVAVSHRCCSSRTSSCARLGRGSFSDLAQAMAVDPAMLFWLDAQQNSVKAPNENLARELMELFTLGHGGGYTEQDVREGARALTGWTLARADGTATFVPARHDNKPKTVLGTTANLDAPGFVRVVLDQPASAPFVATRWWNLVAAPDAPPADTLGRIDRRPTARRRDLAALFAAMLTDPAYAAAAGSLVASPVEWVVGAMRSLSVKPRRRDGEEGRRGHARARPAAAPPTQRQRLALRAGVAVHGVGGDPRTDRRDARQGRRPAYRRGRTARRPRRRRGPPARHPDPLGPHRGRADVPHERPAAPRRRSARQPGEPGDLMPLIPPRDPRKPMDGLTRRTFLRASGVAGATALLAGAAGVTLEQVLARGQTTPLASG